VSRVGGKEDPMRNRVFVGTLLLAGMLATVVLANTGDGVTSARQWATVYLAEPTLIGSTVVQGPVLFTHDEAKTARGEPCTTVYLFEPGKGPAEEVTSFHCIPRPRPVAARFTVRTRPNDALGFGCILTEYQFAGDREGHGVPVAASAH
jgi:hypothetical protein